MFEGSFKATECDRTSVLRGLRGACVRRFCSDPEKGQRQMQDEQIPGSWVFTCVRGGEADGASLCRAGIRSPRERRERSGFGQSLDSSSP